MPRGDLVQAVDADTVRIHLHELERHVTLGEIADRAGVARSTLSNIARGDRTWTTDAIAAAVFAVKTTDVAVDEEPDDWTADAACRGIDPELFFPGRGNNEGTRNAKAVCAGCIVRQDCLEYAVANNERWGVWGGMSERERRRIRLQRKAAS